MRSDFLERQNHDWCTNVTCAGSIKPITAWSILQGKTTVSTCLNCLVAGIIKSGVATTLVRSPSFDCGMYTQIVPLISLHKYLIALNLQILIVLSGANAGISVQTPSELNFQPW